jgi:hypothetical protein
METLTGMPEPNIDISSLKPVKSGEPIDLKRFHNTQVEISEMKVLQVNSSFTQKGPDGQNLKQWVLKVSSPVLLTVGEGDTKIEIRASELFNLSQDKEGKLTGYPQNKDSNLVKFMKDVGATTLEDLKGKKATVKHYEKDIGEGQTRGYLKFKY